MTMVITLGVVGLVSIIVGIFLCFFGCSHYRFFLYIVGYSIAGTLTYIGLLQLLPGDFQYRLLVLFVCTVLLGTLLGFIQVHLVAICVLAVGALCGTVVALYILPMKPSPPGGWAISANATPGLSPDLIVSGSVERYIFIAVVALVFAILAWCLRSHIIVLGTAILGSYLVGFGADVFLATGFSRVLLQGVFDPSAIADIQDNLSDTVLQHSLPLYALMALVALLMAAGVLVQYHFMYKPFHERWCTCYHPYYTRRWFRPPRHTGNRYMTSWH